jgi:hypothetical protein
MVRIDAFLFGYRKIRVSEDMLSEATSRLIRRGIISSLDADGRIVIRERDLDTVKKALLDIELEVSEPLGILGAYRRLKHKKAIVISAFFGAFCYDAVHFFGVFCSASAVYDRNHFILL